MPKTIFTLMILLVATAYSRGADEFNYDESKVPKYTLPELLVDPDGHKIETADAWNSSARAKWMKVVADEVYGNLPTEIDTVKMEVANETTKTTGAINRTHVTLRCSRGDDSIDMHLLIYLPVNATAPVKTFVGLNFNGNHTITDESDIPITKSWVRNEKKRGYENNRASEQSRGSAKSRWPIDAITARGYGLATMYYGDIDPDFHDEFKNGIHALFSDEKRTPASWGSIAAWSWGLSRSLDYFKQDTDIDAKKVALMGHSRLGKTSLWGGAVDERFALVISNDSGCGGAALSRRRFGETVKRINTSFPHWFCDKYKKYNDREETSPVDQHTLIALIAPRPVLICSAQDDRWADPKGEFLSGKNADSVYRLLGTDGMAAGAWPAVNTPIMSRIGYHMRPGGHDVKLQDWNMYMDFADKHLSE